jgi:hypothetical protein
MVAYSFAKLAILYWPAVVKVLLQVHQQYRVWATCHPEFLHPCTRAEEEAGEEEEEVEEAVDVEEEEVAEVGVVDLDEVEELGEIEI